MEIEKLLLEKELSDLIDKYRDKLNIGEINESIIGITLAISSASAIRVWLPLDTLEKYFVDLIKKCIKKARKFNDRD